MFSSKLILSVQITHFLLNWSPGSPWSPPFLSPVGGTEFHHDFSRGENQHPEGKSNIFKNGGLTFLAEKTRSFFRGGYEDFVKLQRAQHFFPPPKF